MAVPRMLKERAKTVVKSLVVHAKHNPRNKQPSHYARVATYHAAHDGLITKLQADEVQYTHHRAKLTPQSTSGSRTPCSSTTRGLHTSR